jgi:predicted GNAT family acetyltransferase
MSDPEVTDDREARRYRLIVDGAEVGYLEYDPIGATSLLIKHTEVHAGHEGKGYGSQLVRHVLDDLRARHLTVVPICPYTLDFVRKHREYVDLVRPEMRSTI